MHTYIIQSKKLVELLDCDICLEQIKICATIKCGHVFCEKCISDWLNDNSNCPNCKLHAVPADITKVFLFEHIKEEILSQRKAEELCNIQNKFHQSNELSGIKSEENPIHKVVFNGLKTLFRSYEDFFINVEADEKSELEKILESNENLDNKGAQIYNLGTLSKSKFYITKTK